MKKRLIEFLADNEFLKERIFNNNLFKKENFNKEFLIENAKKKFSELKTNMTREKIVAYLPRIILSIIGIILILALFLHTRTVNDSIYTRKISPNFCSLALDSLNTTLTETYNLREKDRVIVNIVHVNGELELTIGKRGGKPIYSGDGMVISKFALDITDPGDYDFIVKGDKLEGSITFTISRYLDETEENGEENT